jgi:hypothetical protein
MRIEAPTAFEQTLPAENFVNAGNAAAISIRKIKDRRVRIGELLPQSQQIQDIVPPTGANRFCAIQNVHGFAGPIGKLAQQSANEGRFSIADPEWS